MIGKVLPLRFCRLRQIIAALAVVMTLAVFLPVNAYAGDEMFASLGTGQMNGIYYPVGNLSARW